jgi:hypothetical protein
MFGALGKTVDKVSYAYASFQNYFLEKVSFI